MTKIPIYFTFDNNYVNPAVVAFWSLLDRTREGVFYEMWVLHHDISEESRALLQEVVSKKGNGSLTFINVGDFLNEEWTDGNMEGHQTRDQFTRDTLVRCFGARFFPQYDRIIYSDVDVVFRDDISGLWQLDISEAYLAGVKNAFSLFSAAELSHLSPTQFEMLHDKYVAGGIWVLNLEKIRRDGVERRMLDIISDDSIVKRWLDQDVMNIACEGKVKFMPLNYIAYPYLLPLMRNPKFVSTYSRDELFDSVLHPKIIHYAGHNPWRSADVGYDDEWWAIADYLRLNLPRPRKIQTSAYDRARGKMFYYRSQVRWLVLALAVAILIIIAAITRIAVIQSALTCG